MTDLFEGGASILVGSRNADLVPEMARGYGAVIEPDRQRLTVFLTKDGSERTLANVADNGQIAVVFTSVIDYRSAQAKGHVVETRPATDAERDLIVRYHAAFSEVLAVVGIPRAMSRRLATWPAIAITLEVRDLFSQTPGPRAGERYRAKDDG